MPHPSWPKAEAASLKWWYSTMVYWASSDRIVLRQLNIWLNQQYFTSIVKNCITSNPGLPEFSVVVMDSDL